MDGDKKILNIFEQPGSATPSGLTGKKRVE
jgi:hypothetical protein